MRYLESENLHIICRFTTGDNVTITVYDLSDDTKVVDEAIMSEIETTGYFKYQFNPSPTTLTEYLYIASNGIEEHAGKIILGGYPDGIKNQTDKMNFSGNSIQARVADKGILNNPPSEDIDDYKADVSNLDVAVSTRSSHSDPTNAIKGSPGKTLQEVFDNERGTDGAYTGTPPTVEEIRIELEKAGTKLTDLHDEAFGKWILDPTAKTLTLYKADGVTILKTFDLSDTTNTVPVFIGRTPQ